MSGTVFLAVLGAALLHAAWNALVKGSSDKTLSMGAVVIGHLPIALMLLPFAPTPDAASLPYMVVGVALHFGYQLFLMHSYRIGDLTQVYPIARGSAPLIVAVVSVVLLGVHLNRLELLAVAIIGVGIMSLALVQQQNGQHNRKASILAFSTGLFIAAYSLVDGMGARVAGTSLGFYCWLATANGCLMIAYLARRSPDTLRALPTAGLPAMLLGGSASFIAYAVVTWAFTQASLLKVLSTFTTLLGSALLRYARS